MDKPTLRTQMVQRRRDLTDAEARQWSVEIALRLQRSVNWELVGRLHMYRSKVNEREVDTSWIEAYLSTMWPKIEFSIAGTANSASLPDGQFDVVLVPMVAFDGKRNRIGFGGGWYDRFLATQLTSIAIGLAYDMQQVPQVPIERHDIHLDMIVTESNIYTRQ